LVSPAAAQTAQAGLAQPQADDNPLGDIIVTARKRNESLQSVPISISALNAEQLERRSLTQLRDALTTIPNVMTENTGVDAPIISIRGVTNNTSTVSVESGVGFYQDEVFLARPVLFNANLGDVQRIEVLRGPQGSLFGKNTIGGAVSVFTQDPKFDLAGELSGIVGSRSLWQVRGMINAPIVDDKLAVRVVGFHRQQNGFVKDLGPGRDLGSEDSYGVRGKLLFQPTDTIRNILTVEYGTADNTPFGEDVNGGALAFLDSNPFDRSITTDFPSRDELKTFGLTNRLEVELGNHDLVAISAYRSSNSKYTTDVDGTPADFIGSTIKERMKFFSQEIRIASDQNQHFSYIVGGYYANQKVDGASQITLGKGLADFFAGADVGPFKALNGNDVRIKTDSYAGFVSATYKFTDQFAFTGGLRYTIEKRNLDISQTASEPFALFEPAGFIATIPAAKRSLTDKALSGDATFSWTPNRDTLVYLKYSRGFKGGGFDSNLTTDTALTNIAFKKETADNYEAGLKLTGLDGTLRANITGFYLKYNNKQENLFDGVAGFKTANAASATIKGGEFELTLAPTKGLRFSAGFGYTDARYDKFIDPLLGTDVSGNSLIRAPKWTVSVGGDYSFELTDSLESYIHLDVQHKSRYFTDTSNIPANGAEDRVVVNGRLGVVTSGDRLSIAIFGQNLFNTQRRIFAADVLGGAISKIGFNEPRTIGAEASIKF
jgi:iron complex outermembrane recepter protein